MDPSILSMGKVFVCDVQENFPLNQQNRNKSNLTFHQVSSTNKSDCHDITEIVLKVADDIAENLLEYTSF
jgi:hypothetical protein